MPPTVPSADYGVVPDILSPAALTWFQAQVDTFLATCLAGQHDTIKPVSANSGGPLTLPGFNHALEALGATALYLLGAPALVAAAQARCGPDPVLTHDWFIIKNPGDGEPIAWHQDFVHDRQHPATTFGFHLDETRADAVRIIPGTAEGAQDLCSWRDLSFNDSSRTVCLAGPAGSLAWHDVMLVHGSPALPAGAPARRTVYFEFRARAALLAHPGFPSAFIDLRQQVFAAAQAFHLRIGPAPQGAAVDQLNTTERQLLAKLRTVSAQVDHARYCTPFPGA